MHIPRCTLHFLQSCHPAASRWWHSRIIVLVVASPLMRLSCLRGSPTEVPKYAVILAFDVPVTREAREQSEEYGIKVFTADIIYHLFDQVRCNGTWN